MTTNPDAIEMLRWLLAEAEAGRAKVEHEIHLEGSVEQMPQSWNDAGKIPERKYVPAGARVIVKARTLNEPPLRGRSAS